MLIRNLIKEVKPEVVVLEMCQDRYDHWFYDAIAHPNYDRTLMDVHRLLDKGSPEALLEYKGVDFSKSSSHLEFLVGLDQCSYRNMPSPCQTVFGDRSIKITNKRYKSKVKMLEVYKEALLQH
jgi:pheromone shutdown protein TraB